MPGSSLRLDGAADHRHLHDEVTIEPTHARIPITRAVRGERDLRVAVQTAGVGLGLDGQRAESGVGIDAHGLHQRELPPREQTLRHRVELPDVLVAQLEHVLVAVGVVLDDIGRRQVGELHRTFELGVDHQRRDACGRGRESGAAS